MTEDSPEISPLAPEAFPELPAIDGVGLADCEAGVRHRGVTDVLLAKLAEGTTVAGVFTKSKTAAAPIDWCRSILPLGTAGALVVNSGNANAFTGRQGADAVREMAIAAAAACDCTADHVYIAQTGVIGEPIDAGKITRVLPDLAERLGSDWAGAARAIMTTDTYPKGCARTADIGGVEVNIAGIAKGSGMIAPDMATMLGFIFTDAAIPADILEIMLTRSVDKSFNSITVDSDTSTSDTVLAFATGAAGHPTVAELGEAGLAGFRTALDEVCLDLAQQIVRDGEGASKFVAITVAGAEDVIAARRIGLAIANSPLVKTAIAGEDANWGRIVMAVGKSGEAADRDKLAIAIGGIAVAEAGAVVPGYDEAPVAEHMQGREIEIFVDVGVGDGEATVWTCDLTHRYIEINADYRT
ncbi:MAG: bifunctional glutamate N-acetyltransferase/amino-acid acetyltransferase ArgJ [Rhodospirillales bacterium]|jgi:glutamate N-acetyltransferase/amino-acid N-acetyltransferase|nr:bifunctional ornithine acetyltransferase/N-acetylglutamate synthase [Rhodospirillaceae bacterium]MDP6428669.1 bifunctional glutamate N-acetyltransferase/amino-acid acetyltransferase ArgJ [Rhodospirillales bacterium]MDP6644454.1 bifunctional glutamate N-acetyltransferase/amino-acid acetyltransferase ArgJ [Rhodospirillales bacterium]MDP6842213.1 bifunctional glutamate N-acetyltransferase/amino-acid acetyltransferase ArgJ [Rhodospirillales bacterium]